MKQGGYSVIGIDIISVSKIKEKSDKFLRKIFTSNELSYAFKKENPYQTLAGIFALKEAVIKAYNLDIIYLKEAKIEVLHEKNRPYIYIDGEICECEVSISHDDGKAIAVCMNNEIPNLTIENEMRNILPKRKKESHKGTYGKVAILGGSEGMSGSCFLSSTACLRAGAGLVYLLVPSSISKILQIKSCEPIINTIDSYNLKYNNYILDQIFGYLNDKDVLAIGPGMGTDPSLNKLIGNIINEFNGKIIIDADGLNAVAKDKSVLSKKNIILTPHLKEFSRLTGLSISEINKERIKIAKEFAKKYEIILVLKSENTLVTDGDKLYINKLGNPGMATAGSGDVLTGVISGLLPILNEFDAAKLGVYLHSLAGDLASSYLCEESLIASDIISYLPKAIRLLR
ncbi:YjeF domain protein [Anaerococcus lactolyticus ATCC 51172]|uniref:Multifunctional fusion protein n=1 Tax=Anaerococcus lactolyticus ATCC 51172 TaxID=525254 RepID=C2BDJ6_9FIRM|nr:YjeF domain protein [Anaerococcus lactolyticus ATCC 51172]